MKIAIIGGGIAGNTLAYHLYKQHNITLYDANSHIGGHTHTHDITFEGRPCSVDTGFIVFNDRTYPNFIEMLETLGVNSQASNMSFSVRCEKTGLEYNGTSLNCLFAQRRNFFKPAFYGMIADILRFNKEALALLSSESEITLGDYLIQNQYKETFIDHYIIPMGAAIWSTDAANMMGFPARFLVRFFHHHGFLTVNDRPQWRTITGGSARYAEALTAPFKDRIQLNSPVQSVKRLKNQVLVKPQNAAEQAFDYVFFACHSDEALAILGQGATPTEIEILSAIPYQENTVYLHHDATMMPRRKLAWAAWNYHITKTAANTKTTSNKVQVTYNMNILQNIQSKQPLLVTLNHTDGIDHEKVIKKLKYSHPLYTIAGAAAQLRHAEISGKNRTCFAGAYWRNGFHEDGVVSALEALKHFDALKHVETGKSVI